MIDTVEHVLHLSFNIIIQASLPSTTHRREGILCTNR